MAIDRDAEHLPLHPPIEALHQAIRLRRVGLRAVEQLSFVFAGETAQQDAAHG